MPTKLAVDDDLLAEAVKLGGHGTKLETINEALREYIARRKRQAAIRAFGSFAFDPRYDYKRERQQSSRGPSDMSHQHPVTELEQVFAVFIDLMGFADKLELLSDKDHAELHRALEDNLIPRRGEPQPPLEGAYWPYFHFHTIVDGFVNDVSSDCKMVAVFSDSAFVATSSLTEAEDIAACVTGQAIFLGAYTRIGIGYGTLARLDWHSRIRLSGALTMSSPFLGTSITRAYRAQQGCMGFRILLHPSVKPAFQDPSWHRVPLQGKDLTKDRNAELNFMDTLSDYSLDDHLLKKLALMKLSAPDERSREHYDATERAMQNLHALGATQDWNGRRRPTVIQMLKLVFNDP